jgi:transcriptional regulator with XRE-family HTH domain
MSVKPLNRVRVRPRTLGEARLTLLRERGVTLSKIARDLGLDLSSVSRVNRGQRRSSKIERRIARRLGLPLREAFPEWHLSRR